MSIPKIIGIVNITPDSFSGDGLYASKLDHEEAVIKQCNDMFHDGAEMVDIGAESTRPNATKLSADEEWQRLEPIVRQIFVGSKKFPSFSLDTYHPETVQKASRYGVFVINDVTGMADSRMQKIAATSGLPCIVSHLPKIVHGDIQAAHRLGERLYSDINQVKDELIERASELIKGGVNREKIILDPGIGFGKTMELNRELLTFAQVVPDWPVVIGYSRKRFLGENRMELEPNLEACRIAQKTGASYIRVHDVAEHRKFLDRHN